MKSRRGLYVTVFVCVCISVCVCVHLPRVVFVRWRLIDPAFDLVTAASACCLRLRYVWYLKTFVYLVSFHVLIDFFGFVKNL